MSITLLNTRPAHQAEALNRLLELKGMGYINCPTLKIEWLNPGWDTTELVTKPNRLIEKIIFVSRNAVEGFLAQVSQGLHKDVLENADLYAIGQATKQFGLDQGLHIQTLSDRQFDSEHFLAHPVMQDINGKRILLVKGKGGRDLIVNTLECRGAEIDTIEVYQRAPEAFCEQSWREFTLSENPVLLITSVASWQALLKGQQETTGITSQIDVFQQGSWRNLKGIVCMSERIAEFINQSEWHQLDRPIKVVETQSNEGIIESLTSFTLERCS